MKITIASFVFSLLEFSLALAEFSCTLVEPVYTFGEGVNYGLSA